MTPRRATLRAAGTVALLAAGHQMLTGSAGVRGVPRAQHRVAVPDRNLDSELRFYAAWYAVAGWLMHKAAGDAAFDRQVSGPLSTGWAMASVARVLSVRAVGRPDPVFLALMVAEAALAVVLGAPPALGCGHERNEDQPRRQP